MSATAGQRVRLSTIAKEWTRIGVTGFGGPPAHIALLRALCVDKQGWLASSEFEDGIATTSLLPGPTSTQLAIFCAWKLRGGPGAVLGGLCFILPGLVLILGLSVLFLARHPPRLVEGIAAGAGAGVPAVAVRAALGLVPASWARVKGARARETRWFAYLLLGCAAGAIDGQYLVLALLGSGLIETVAVHRTPPEVGGRVRGALPFGAAVPALGSLGALVWVAFKVGALSYGGGFVIVPLMQHDAVSTYHWMSNAQFLNAVALGQITPGPVVQTVAVVGYAARGLRGGLLASLVAFAPSFLFVIVGAPHLGRLRRSTRVQSFLTGAGACAIGGIGGVVVPLTAGLAHLWNFGVALLAAAWLLGLRKSIVIGLLLCGVLGAVAAFAHAPLG